MLKYLPIVLFIAMTRIDLSVAVTKCSTTKCHGLFYSGCPKGQYVQSWSWCRWFFGKYENCCYDEPDIINQDEKKEQTANPFQNKNPTKETPTSGDAVNRNGELSPLVRSMSWGRVDVEGYDEPFRDVKLYPGGAVAWDWRKTDTHHQPGIQPDDLDELLTNGCEIIILTRGIQNLLHTTTKTRELLESHGMQLNGGYFILQSEEAVELYNKYVEEKKRVCAIIHSTC